MDMATRQDSAFMRVALFAAAALVCIATAVASWQWAQPSANFTIPLFSQSYYQLAAQADKPADQIKWAKKSIDVAPQRAENWLLLASAYQDTDGKVSPRVLQALRKSYQVTLYSPDVSRWRISYIFTNWPFAPTDLRQRAISEAALDLTRPTDRTFLQQLAGNLQDDSARATLGLLIAQAERKRSNSQSVM